MKLNKDDVNLYDKSRHDLTSQLQKVQKLGHVLIDDSYMKDSVREVKNHLETIKGVCSELTHLRPTIQMVIITAQQFVNQHQDDLTQEQMTQLSPLINSLDTTFKKVLDSSEKRLGYIKNALGNLEDFEKDYKTSLEKATNMGLGNLELAVKRMEDLKPIETKQKEMMNDILQHQGYIQGMQRSVEKYVKQAQEYNQEVEKFQAGSNRPNNENKNNENNNQSAKKVTDDLKALKVQYDEIKSRCTSLGETVSDLKDKQQRFDDPHSKLISWLADAQIELQKNDVSHDLEILKPQLVKVESLKTGVDGQFRNWEDVLNKSQDLINKYKSLEAESKLINKIVSKTKETKARYDEMCNAVTNKLSLIQNTITLSRGIQDAVANLSTRLDYVEQKIGSQQSFSLDQKTLLEQRNQFTVIAQEVDSNTDSITSIRQSVKSSDLKHDKQLEQNMLKIEERFKEAKIACNKLNKSFNEIVPKVSTFYNRMDEIMKRIKDKRDELDDPRPQSQTNSLDKKLDKIEKDRFDIIKESTQLKSIAQELELDDRTENSRTMTEAIGKMETKLLKFDGLLSKKKSDFKKREQKGKEFKTEMEVLLNWLTSTETSIGSFGPVAVSVALINEQIDSRTRIAIEYQEKAKAVNNLSELSSHAMTSDGKKSLKQNSSNVHLTEALAIKKRYDVIGQELAKREKELTTSLSTFESFERDKQNVIDLLAQKKAQLQEGSNSSMSIHEDEAKKQYSAHQALHRDLQNNAGLIQHFNKKGKDLLKDKKAGVPGLNVLQDELSSLDKAWNGLLMTSGNRNKQLEDAVGDLEKFKVQEQEMVKWISQQNSSLNVTMMSPFKVQGEQVKILRNEFSNQSAKIEQFQKSGGYILAWCKGHIEDETIVQKRIDDGVKAWGMLQERLEERESMVKSGDEFASITNDMVTWIGQFNGKLDKMSKVSSQPDKLKKQRKELQALQTELKKKKLDQEKTREIFDKLNDKVKDEPNKAEFKSKMDAVDAKMENIVQKLDKRAESLTDLSRRVELLESECEEMKKTIANLDGDIGSGDDQPIVFYGKEQLNTQVANNKEFLQKLERKEPDIKSLLGKGHKLIGDAFSGSEHSELKSKLEEVNKQWTELKNKAETKKLQLVHAAQTAQEYQTNSDTSEIALEMTEKKSKETTLKKFEKIDIDRKRRNLKSLEEEVSKLKAGHIILKSAADNLLKCVEDPELQIKAKVDEVKDRLVVVNTEITSNLAKVENADQSLSRFERNFKSVAEQMEAFENTFKDLVREAKRRKDDTLIEDIKISQNSVLQLADKLPYLESLLNGAGLDDNVDCTVVNGNILKLRTRHHNLTSDLCTLTAAIESGSPIPGNFKSGQQSDQSVKQVPGPSTLDSTMDRFIEQQLVKQMASDGNTGTGAGAGANPNGKQQDVKIIKGSNNNNQQNNNNNNNNNINADERNNTDTSDSFINGFQQRRGVTIITDSNNANKNNFNNNNNDNVYGNKSGDNKTNDSDNDDGDGGTNFTFITGSNNANAGNNNDNNNRNMYGATAASPSNLMERNHATNTGQNEGNLHATELKQPVSGSSDRSEPRGFAAKAWNFTKETFDSLTSGGGTRGQVLRNQQPPQPTNVLLPHNSPQTLGSMPPSYTITIGAPGQVYGQVQGQQPIINQRPRPSRIPRIAGIFCTVGVVVVFIILLAMFTS